MKRVEPLTTEVQRERERCQQIAESVMISSRKIRESGGWTEADCIAWEARERAASNILSSIRAGIEP